MKKLMENLTLAVIVLVVSIPEGLPMTIDVSLGYSTVRMFKQDKVLVRDVHSLEKSGQITELLVGKTGQLTNDWMSVEAVLVAEKVLERPELNQSASILSFLFENIQFNNQVHIEIDDQANYVPVG